MNEYNNCYEEAAIENPCFHYKEPLYYEKFKREYPKVPSNSSIYTLKFMRKYYSFITNEINGYF